MAGDALKGGEVEIVFAIGAHVGVISFFVFQNFHISELTALVEDCFY